MNARRAGEEAGHCKPAPAWVLVHRHGLKRFRLPLVREQFDVMSALVAGRTLGEALEAAADREGADIALMMGSVGEWLRDFAARGLFCGIEEGTGG